MNRAACVTVVLCVASWCVAQTAPLVPPELLAHIEQQGPTSLPKYLTPEERLLPLPSPVREGRQPPAGVVYCPAEYEYNDGLLIAWEGYTSILTQMTVAITTGDPQATVYVVVDSSSEQSSAYSTLSGAGADMDQVEFIIRTTDTVWIRDYGPRYIFEDGQRAIIDHNYNRPRPNDNALNDYLATLWGQAEYDIPLTHGGGNFHLFSNGDAFMTELILNENPGLSEQDVIDYYGDYQNVNLTITDAFPTYVDSTQHIDMWMLPLGDYKVLIGEYTFDPPREITDGVAANLASQGYTVYRTPGWTSGGTHYTYTNATILNDQVFISKFNHTNDAVALAVFQSAMPGYRVQQIDCSGIISAAGALHCIVMHVPGVPGPIPVVTVRAPDGGEVWTVGQVYDIEWTAHDDVGVTSVDIYLSTDGGLTFPDEVATGLLNSGIYPWVVPPRDSEQCRIKVIAHDGDGNSGEDVSDADFSITPFAPQVIYDFPLDMDPGWTAEPLWAFGQPAGQGGEHGGPDPTSGHTGDYVYGYNLNGDYENSLQEKHLTTTALDCTNMSGVKLAFWRWLGVEQPAYDHAYIRVSNNGLNWTPVWTNLSEITDTAWTYQEFDISGTADDQAEVYVRWTMGTTDSAWQYCGWNIDDVQIIAVPTYVLGDLNCDGAVNAFDIDPFVLALTDPDAYADSYPDCHIQAGDINGDGVVNGFDIDGFVGLLTGR